MQNQNTIFMALEQQQSQQQTQQQQQQPTQQDYKSITKFTCAYCNQSRLKNGFFRIFKNIGMQFFCSKKCSNRAKKNIRRIICKTCGKSFINTYSVKNRKYCSRPCGRKDQPDRYKVFNWCSMCNIWIKKTDSKLRPAGTIIANGYQTKKDDYICPICNNRLRLGSKYNNKKKKKINDTTTKTTNKTETL